MWIERGEHGRSQTRLELPLAGARRVHVLDPAAVLDDLLRDAYDAAEYALVVLDQIGVLGRDRLAQRQVRVLERLLHLQSAVRALADVVGCFVRFGICCFISIRRKISSKQKKSKRTQIERIFDAEDAGTVAVVELFDDLLLGHVGAAVAHPDARAHVVELLAVELEELDEQHAQVVVVAARVNARMKLKTHTHTHTHTQPN